VSGFYVLHVREFEPLVEAARRNERCRVHDVVAGYRLIEFDGPIQILRSETKLGAAVWFGCLTAGLDGKITEFTEQRLCIAPTNEPIVKAPEHVVTTRRHGAED
jgi:hypothetical protein